MRAHGSSRRELIVARRPREGAKLPGACMGRTWKPSRFSKKTGFATSGSSGSGNGTGCLLCVSSARSLPAAFALTSSRTMGQILCTSCTSSKYVPGFTWRCPEAHSVRRGHQGLAGSPGDGSHRVDHETAILPGDRAVCPPVEHYPDRVEREICSAGNNAASTQGARQVSAAWQASGLAAHQS